MNHSEDKWLEIKRERTAGAAGPPADSRLSSSAEGEGRDGGGPGRGGGVSARGQLGGQLHLSAHILHSISHQSGQCGSRRNSARPPTFLILIPKKTHLAPSFSIQRRLIVLTSASAQRDASRKWIRARARFLLSSPGCECAKQPLLVWISCVISTITLTSAPHILSALRLHIKASKAVGGGGQNKIPEHKIDTKMKS